MDTPERLKDLELFGWLGEDELGSGEIGLKRGLVPAGDIPMVVVGRDLWKLKKYWPQAEAQAAHCGKRIYLCRFDLAQVVRETLRGAGL